MTSKMWNKIDIFFDIYKFYLILCSEPVVADSLISSFKKIAKHKFNKWHLLLELKKSFKIIERYQGEIVSYVIIICILL